MVQGLRHDAMGIDGAPANEIELSISREVRAKCTLASTPSMSRTPGPPGGSWPAVACRAPEGGLCAHVYHGS